MWNAIRGRPKRVLQLYFPNITSLLATLIWHWQLTSIWSGVDSWFGDHLQENVFAYNSGLKDL